MPSDDDKSTGMLLGVVYGDAMGAPCEFNGRRARAFDGVISSDSYFDKRSQYGYRTRHKVGQVTDDTEITIACFHRPSSLVTQKKVRSDSIITHSVYSLMNDTASYEHETASSTLCETWEGQS